MAVPGIMRVSTKPGVKRMTPLLAWSATESAEATVVNRISMTVTLSSISPKKALTSPRRAHWYIAVILGGLERSSPGYGPGRRRERAPRASGNGEFADSRCLRWGDEALAL